MSEDDDTTCQIKDDEDYLNDALDIGEGIVDGYDAIQDEEGDLGWVPRVARALIQVVTTTWSAFETNDDFIGEIVGGPCDGQPYKILNGSDVDGCATIEALGYE